MLHAEMCSHCISRKDWNFGGWHHASLYNISLPQLRETYRRGWKSGNVFYLQPYVKSYVSELYPDLIEIDSQFTTEGKVPFKQFEGYAPSLIICSSSLASRMKAEK